jgi:predicted DNA-binding transcriptional regulator AlpA
MATKTEQNQLLTRKDMMELLKISSATLDRQEKKGALPPAIRRPGCFPRWRRTDVEAMINNN